jgi:hypothetical protein
MSTKLIGILVATIVILLGILIAVMNSKPEQPAAAPAAVAAPAPVQTEPPHLDKKRGSFKKSEPRKWGYRSPD